MKRMISAALSAALMLSVAAPIAVNAAPAQINELKQLKGDKNSVKFTWNALLGNDVRYFVEASTDKVNWEDYTESYNYDNEITIRNLQPGKSYFVRVKAKKDEEFGEYSEPFEVVTAPDDATGVIQSEAAASSASIKWDAADGANKYYVCEWVNGEHVREAVDSTTYTFTGLNNKEKYPYEVYVRSARISASGFEATEIPEYSFEISSTCVKDGLKLKPAKTKAPRPTSLLSSIGIIYTENDKTANQDGIQVEIRDNKNKVIATGNGTRFEGINGGEFYKIRSRAYINLAGDTNYIYGPWSSYNYFCNGNPDISVNSGKTKLSVSWNKIKGATSYTVYAVKGTGKNFKKIKTVKGRSLTIKKIGGKKLKKNTAYTVKVVANKKVGKTTFKSLEATRTQYTKR